ncbi:MAG TPA: tRNA pseudouridine(38-40) synthase TruA [Chloroflexota bacterium]|nr:tRNA pseudouridine(38-40) synthase TruA [Chloroflexota bacterium]
MRNVKLVVEYDGADYHGFEIQVGLRTIQGELERAIALVTETQTRVVGSGRTDAGAHALGQVVSFRTGSRLSGWDLRRALNATLPQDIVVKSVEEVAESFHARRSAARRNYRYSIWNAQLRSVWTRRYRHQVIDPLSVEAMNLAAEVLVGTRDFACFTYGLNRYLGEGKFRTTVRTLFTARWSGKGPELDFDVSGTAFLPHMIRNMVGSMLRVGVGKLTPEEYRGLVESGAEQLSAVTVPACGLTLVSVEY